jgi:hypothetical protein
VASLIKLTVISKKNEEKIIVAFDQFGRKKRKKVMSKMLMNLFILLTWNITLKRLKLP